MSNTVKMVIFVAGAFIVFLLFFIKFGSPSLTSDSNKVQKVYFADHISPAHRAVIDRFNQKYAGRIEVVAVDLPFSKFNTNERKELLARSLRSKSDRLDIFSVDYIWTARFAKWSEPLDAYFSDADKSAIISPVLQSCISDGKLVAMPLFIDIGMMYYRRDYIQKLPDPKRVEEELQQSITWDRLIALQKPLGMANKPYYVFQGYDYEGLICNYFEMIASLDHDYFQKNTIRLTTPVAHEALQTLVDFVYKSRISPPEVLELDENKCYEYMISHDAMFVRGWSNFLESARPPYNDSDPDGVIGRAPLPHFKGEAPTSVYGGWNLMVSKFSTKKEAAVEFIRYLQTPEAKKIMFEIGDYIPVNRDVYNDTAYVRAHPKLLFYRQLISHGFHRPSLVDYTRIADIIAHYVHLALKKEMSVDEALAKASQIINSNEVLIK